MTRTPLIGIVAALAAEARTLTGGPMRSRTEQSCRFGTLALAGVGPERAAAAAERLVNAGADALLAWGTAGALHASLRPGRLLLPSRVIDAGGCISYLTDARWHARACTVFASLSPATDGLVTSHRAASTAQDKRALATASGAHAVDMESAAVARIAARHGLPFLAIRAVLDPADYSLPPAAVTALRPDGSLHKARLAVALTRAPWHTISLFRLSGYFRTAIATLAAATVYLPDAMAAEPTDFLMAGADGAPGFGDV